MKFGYFKRQEFQCHCGCNFAAIDYELLDILNLVRDHFGRSVFINSGCRCKSYNKEIGGSKKSFHMAGMACDIIVDRVSPDEVYDFLDFVFPTSKGIGKYETFTHIDVRELKSRW